MPRSPIKVKRLMGRILRLCAMLGIVALVLYLAGVDETLAILKQTDLRLVGFCLAIEMIFYVVESVRIYFLANKDYSFGLIVRSRLLSAFVGNALPGLALGELARVLILGAHTPKSKLKILSLLLLNRIYGLLSLIVILCIAILLVPAEQIPMSKALQTIAFLSLGLIFVPLSLKLAWVRKILIPLLRRLPRGMYRPMRRAYLAQYHSARFSTWLIALISSTFTNGLVIGQFWLIAKGAGLNESYLFWTIVTPLVSIFSFLPIGVGALGVQDVGMVGMAKLFNKPAEMFLATSVIIHAVRILGTLPGLFYVHDLKMIWTSLRRNPDVKV